MSELVSLFKGRTAFYEYFASAFLEPADACFLQMTKSILPHFISLANETDDKHLKEGSAELRLLIDNGISQELEGRINQSFTALFLIGKGSVPTAESVYLSPARLLKQEQWEERFRCPAGDEPVRGAYLKRAAFYVSHVQENSRRTGRGERKGGK